ncbi:MULTISPECIES: DUF1566 domain-containing protein [unclassified Flavobacterium]|uniref:DUF1566 domain-containing protein n=1 Tax=unclassified Flavobacterium TaxID=196869 RepID=UPI000F107993|nr:MULTISPECIES: DUF1566 domain-containing protein [unclassified Flavobacterium]RKS00627.1 hypothetical protein C8C84_0248 [Flavobacterium sp. 102]
MKKIIQLSKIATLLFIMLIINSYKDLDDSIVIPNAKDLIHKDDKLFCLIERIAKEALGYQLNGKKDWFLPSENELALLYTNLHQQNPGNFTNVVYWDSTEIDVIPIKTIDFSNGQNVVSSKVSTPKTV